MSAYIVFTRDRQVREHRIKGAVSLRESELRKRFWSSANLELAFRFGQDRLCLSLRGIRDEMSLLPSSVQFSVARL
jgi:hypothetical protein